MNLINVIAASSGPISSPVSTLKIWAAGDPHLQQSIDQISYNSLAEPIADIDAIGFNWDLALNVGDFDSHQVPPTLLNNITEGENVSSALNSSLIHDRAKIYTLNGNHDAGDGDMEWFERYLDINGTNTAYSGVDTSNRPYPITYMDDDSDNWHSYYITVGNLLIFMISDRNELPGLYGRGGLTEGNGGYPSGTISKATWEWVKAVILANTNKNIWVCTHMNPRNTTIATPDGDGVAGDFHGTTGYDAGSGSIYSIYDEDTPGNSDNATTQITDFFAANPSHSVSLWMAGHTHTRVNETYNSKSIKFSQDGVQYLNIASLTKTWVNAAHGDVDSRSWTIEINGINVNLKNYIHNPETGGVVKGYREDQEFNITLKHTFNI